MHLHFTRRNTSSLFALRLSGRVTKQHQTALLQTSSPSRRLTVWPLPEPKWHKIQSLNKLWCEMRGNRRPLIWSFTVCWRGQIWSMGMAYRDKQRSPFLFLHDSNMDTHYKDVSSPTCRMFFKGPPSPFFSPPPSTPAPASSISGANCFSFSSLLLN